MPKTATARGYAAAGPIFNHENQPPWYRPGKRNKHGIGPKDCPPWPQRCDRFRIPIPQGLTVPNRNAAQLAVNSYLTQLDLTYGTAGPSVFRQEISSSSLRNRFNEFEGLIVAGQGSPSQPYLVKDIDDNVIPLAAYSGCARTFVKRVRLARGAIGLVASRASVAKADAKWHNTAILVLRLQKYPFTSTRNGTFTRILLYNPSHCPLAMADNTMRIEHMDKLMSIARAILDSLVMDKGMKWAIPSVKDEIRSVRIGGGSNTFLMEECRYMACVWVAQVAWLVNQLQKALQLFRVNPTEDAYKALQQAHDEFEAFHAGYADLVQ